MKQTNLTRGHSEAVTRGLVAATAARSYSWIEELANDSGVDILEGQAVVVLADGTIQLADVENDPRPTGIAVDDIEDGDSGQVCFGGPVDLVSVGSAVTGGDYGQTSTTPGEVQVTGAVGRAFLEFTESGTTPSAFLWGGRGGGGVVAGVVVEDFPTDETDVTLVLHPDGTGGIVWGVDATGGGSLPWFNVQTDGTAVGDGVTDDTAAIQSAIDTATASGTQSAIIFFPPGVYLIGGALQDTGAKNAQILIPTRSTSDATITIYMLGQNRPPMAMAGPVPDGSEGMSVLKSTLTGASGTAAVFSGGQYPVDNNVNFIIQNFLCFYPADPSMTFWNFDSVKNPTIRDVIGATTPAWYGYPTQPTHSNAYFVKGAHYGIANRQVIDGLVVNGYYTALLQTDLMTTDGLVGGFCIVGVELPAGQHSSYIEMMEWIGCPTPIKVTGVHYADIRQASFEHWNSVVGAPAWIATTYDVDDPSNYLHGHIRWYLYDPITGLSTTGFTVNGGANIAYEQFGELPAGTVIVQDEGTPLSTRGSTLNFVGAGVVASGTGATKTITIGGSSVSALDDLSDVTITSATSGDRLRYSGSAWVNSALRWEPHVAYDGTVVLDGNGDPVMVEVA